MRIALLLILLAFGAPAGAQVYKWKDADGKTHFGDRPPPEAKTEEIKVRVPEGTPQAQGVTMYATSWCGVCQRARRYFAEKGIAYTEIDVEKSAAGRREFERLGGRGVPLIVADGKVMRGFSPEGFERLRPGKS